MNAKTLAKAAVEAVMELVRNKDLRIYEEVGAMVLQVPDQQDRVFAILESTATPGCTLTLLRGEGAPLRLSKWMLDGGEDVLDDRNADLIQVGLSRMKEMDTPHLRVLERAGYPPSKLAPVFVVHSHSLHLCCAPGSQSPSSQSGSGAMT